MLGAIVGDIAGDIAGSVYDFEDAFPEQHGNLLSAGLWSRN